MRRQFTRRWGAGPPVLDDQTCERLLSGLPAADAPPGYAAAAQLLRRLEEDASPDELAGETSAVAAIATATSPALRSSARRSTMTKLRSAKLALAGALGALTLTAGLAAAGALPGAAQDVAANVLNGLGVSTTGPNSHAGTHPDSRGASASHISNTTDPPNTPPTTTKGSQISGLATGTDQTGVNKGAEISTAASGDQSQAGQHGTPLTSVPPVNVPGGAGTGNQASNGHASAGAGNAAGGLNHRP